MSRRIHAQKGNALIVTLVLLTGLTMIILSSFNLGVSDLKIVGNVQYRAQAEAAAQQAIEVAISGQTFFKTPSAVYPSPCAGQNTYCADVNGDNDDDVTVTLTPNPACVQAKTIKNAELDLENSEDLGCAVGVQQNFGVQGAATGDSLCAQTTWQIRAQAEDPVTATRAAVVEGVAVRVAIADMTSNCP